MIKIKVIQIWIPIIISFIALLFSGFSWYQSNKRQEYFDSTNFNIVQNLWQDNPNYTLYNESVKPLDSPPHPAYFMYIPSKLYIIFPDGNRFSCLILLPVSYVQVVSQVGSGKTVDEIEVSQLPQNFYARKGSRDIRLSNFDSENSDVTFELRTYPFLAIATQVKYSYKDDLRNVNEQIFISTPVNRINLTSKEFQNLKDYTKNMTYFSQNEMKPDGEKNIYDTTHAYLLEKIQQSFKECRNNDQARKEMYVLMGVIYDVEERYPEDSKNEQFDFSKVGPSELNFNAITEILLEKGLIPQDPLVPDF